MTATQDAELICSCRRRTISTDSLSICKSETNRFRVLYNSLAHANCACVILLHDALVERAQSGSAAHRAYLFPDPAQLPHRCFSLQYLAKSTMSCCSVARRSFRGRRSEKRSSRCNKCASEKCSPGSAWGSCRIHFPALLSERCRLYGRHCYSEVKEIY